MRAGSVAVRDEQRAPQVQRQADVAVSKDVVARRVERAEQCVGRRLGEPVEFAEDDQRAVAETAGQRAEAPQGAHEASRRRVRGRGGRPRESPPGAWRPPRLRGRTARPQVIS